MAESASAGGNSQGETRVFKDIVNSTQTRGRGILTLNPEGIRFTAKGSNETMLKKENISKASWTPIGEYGLLHVYGKGENSENRVYERFDGFGRSDAGWFRKAFEENFKVELTKAPVSCSGLHVGNIDVDQEKKAMEMSYEGKVALELPLKSISQCVKPNKNDIELHFHEGEHGANEDELLIEMKFYVPPDEDGEEQAESLKQKLSASINVQHSARDVICRFTEDIGLFKAPHGKYELLLFDKHFQMIGKTYQYTIMYKNVSRMFLLEKESSSKAFIISLNDPLSQGQKRYKHLVMFIDIRDEEVEVNMSREKLRKYEGKLTNPMAGSLPEVVAKLFKILTGKKVFVASKFQSAHDHKFVKCALKANTGALYPLAKAFFFIHKPATFIRYEDIQHIEFQRRDSTGQASSRNFDLEVSVRSVNGEQPVVYQFSGIQKQEYNLLFSFLEKKKIIIKDHQNAKLGMEDNSNASSEYALALELGDDSEGSDDADFGSDDEAHDSDSGSETDVTLVSEDDHGDSSDESGGEPSSSTAADRSPKKRKREDKPKKLAKRDPKAPKNPKSAYAFFAKEKHAEMEDIPFGERATKISDMWKSLDDKSKYEKLHDEDQARFKKEMETYKPSIGYAEDGNLIGASTSKKKSTKDPNAPKQPKRTYDFWKEERIAELRKTDTESTYIELSSKIAPEWKKMSTEDKAKYEKLHKDDVARFEEELKSYKPPEGYNEKGVLISSIKKSSSSSEPSVKRGKRDPKAPKKHTAYSLFSAERRDALKESEPDLPFGEINKRLGKEWRELSDSDKADWEKKKEKDDERYEEEMKKYVPPTGYDAEGYKIGEPEEKKKKNKKEKALKRPPKAYNIFVAKRKSALQDKGVSPEKMRKQLSAEWKNLDIKMRRKYKEEERKLLKEYEAKLKSKTEEEGGEDDDDADDESSDAEDDDEDDDDDEDEEEEEEDKKVKSKKKSPSPSSKNQKGKKKKKMKIVEEGMSDDAKSSSGEQTPVDLSDSDEDSDGAKPAKKKAKK